MKSYIYTKLETLEGCIFSCEVFFLQSGEHLCLVVAVLKTYLRFVGSLCKDSFVALEHYSSIIFQISPKKIANRPCHDFISWPLTLQWKYFNTCVDSMGRKLFSGQYIASFLLPPPAEQHRGIFQQIIACSSPILCQRHGTGAKKVSDLLECIHWAGLSQPASSLPWRLGLGASQRYWACQ